MAEKKLSVEVGKLIEDTLDQLTLEGKSKVKERNKKISSEDTQSNTEPEPFTEDNLIKPVFRLLDLKDRRERIFRWGDKKRSVDYEIENEKGDKFLLEAKKINSNLTANRTGAAVEQIKQVFQLSEVKQNYEFGIATDGLTWIIINKEGEEVDQLNLEKDIFRIQELLKGERKPVSEKKQEEITDKFYNWYDALLHGGKYKDRNNETKHIAEEDAFVNNIYSAKDKDKPEIAQTIANRLIFIKFLQSKGIIQDDILAELADLEQSELNRKMKELFFQVMNTPEEERVNISDEFKEIPYLNGSLFKRNDAEERNVDYQVRYDILHRFVEFLDRFAFVNEESLEEKEAIDPKILGYIFERAMTDAERKSTGAYYTPRAVTQYIAEQTVYPTILEKANNYLKEEKGYNEEELYDSVDEMIRKCRSLWDIRQKILVEDFRVVDPACGSGAFLLAVANILWDIHKRIGEQLGDSEADNDAWLKKLILRHNIYGVDVNHNATEIARLRLWLWLVDSFNRNNLEALPNIDYKIVSGNSLTGFADITQMKREGELSGQNNLAKWDERNIADLFREKNEKTTRYEEISGEEADKIKNEIDELERSINTVLDDYYITWCKDNGVELPAEDIENFDIFHWGAEFSRVFDPDKKPEERGFDVVVGNPPYIKYRDLKKVENQILDLVSDLDYYETPFHCFDIAVPFLERSHNLLSDSGELGFIMTNKWMKQRYGKKLRVNLKEEQSVSKVIDFTDQQVFKGLTTYTMILFLNKKRNDKIRYAEIDEIDGNIRERLSKVHKDIENGQMRAFDASYENLTAETWTFIPKIESEILNDSDFNDLDAYAESIYQGVVPGENPFFILDLEERKEDTCIVSSDLEEEKFEIEQDICKILCKGEALKRWGADKDDKVIVYPYEVTEEDWRLLSRDEIAEKYPKAWMYFERNKDTLEDRGDDWHGFNTVRPNNIHNFNKKKAVVAYLSNRSKMSLDREGEIIMPDGASGGVGVTLDEAVEDVSYQFIVALINSRLFEWMVEKTSSGFKGNSFAYTKKYIKNKPVPTGNQQKQIEILSEDLMNLAEDSRKENEEDMRVLENLIDFLVYEMYFDKFGSSLLEEVKETISGISDPNEKARKIRESSEVEKIVADMEEDEKIKIVDSGKLRDQTW